MVTITERGDNSMPQMKLATRILIASPSDVQDARKIIAECIEQWNYINSHSSGMILEPVRWETHSYPELGQEAQSIINWQIVDDCDIVVGCFRSRLGTPTADHRSGTAEEIERAVKARKPTLLYFLDMPIPPSQVDFNEYQRLSGFRAEMMQRGVVHVINSLEVLRADFGRHLGQTINALDRNRDTSLVAVQLGNQYLLDHIWRRLSRVRVLLEHEIPQKLRREGTFDLTESFAVWHELRDAISDHAPFLPLDIVNGTRNAVAIVQDVERAFDVLRQALAEGRDLNQNDVLGRFDELYSSVVRRYTSQLDQLADLFRRRLYIDSPPGAGASTA
jgi:hypothetical protein